MAAGQHTGHSQLSVAARWDPMGSQLREERDFHLDADLGL